MLIKRPDDIRPSEITPRSVYDDRRSFMLGAGAIALAGSGMLPGAAQAQVREKIAGLRPAPAAYTLKDPLNTYEQITSYVNFYEFGTDKSDPLRNSKNFRTRPWTVSVEGEVRKPRTFSIEELLKLAPIEERIYRLRCVEAWSMVIPWAGYSLSELIRQVEPTANAKFVEFHTLADPKQMPGLKDPVLQWPYVEGLRMDEAMNPLTLLGLGLYGELLPNPNGAPVRLVVPWKYGFKSGKSIVRIRFVEQMPTTAWMRSAPSEYGFYSNVNPKVDHPRWSQARERRIGEFFKRETLMFNGYAEQVASLYTGMDLRKQF
ncbi:MAG: protein-methionine-sulfoxide reductase catalytic subunit MsrP [Burkholderiales bacterium]|nr:protein-methionine-sulfoxide reductase catalytic subunit MsrP [Burkholderiales bacterium]